MPDISIESLAPLSCLSTYDPAHKTNLCLPSLSLSTCYHHVQTPQPNFKMIKQLYPWYFHRFDKKGNVCVHYRLGKLQLPKLFAQGIGPDDVFQHNVFYQEYLWTVSHCLNEKRVCMCICTPFFLPLQIS